MGERVRTGKPSRYVTSDPGQLSLAIPPWVGTMSTIRDYRGEKENCHCRSAGYSTCLLSNRLYRVRRGRAPAVNDDRSFMSKLLLGLVYLTNEFNEALAVVRYTLFRPVGELELSYGPTLAVLNTPSHITLLLHVQTHRACIRLRFASVSYLSVSA